jgi:hypothetical protein
VATRIYHVVAPRQASLYRLNDGRFQVVRDGELSSILTGYGYVLVTEEVLRAFRRAGVSAVDRPAVVFDSAASSQMATYREIEVTREVAPRTIDEIALDDHLWCHARRDLFVSLRRFVGNWLTHSLTSPCPRDSASSLDGEKMSRRRTTRCS